MTARHRHGCGRTPARTAGSHGGRSIAGTLLLPLALVTAVTVAATAGTPLHATAAPAGGPGTITTYAGGGSGDGWPATRVPIWPGQLATDSDGTLYIADAGGPDQWTGRTMGHRVRMVRDGVITTLAGTGDPGSSGDGGDARRAQLDMPGGLAVDSGGNVYISDAAAGNVRRVDRHGIITTLVSQLTTPQGLALDRHGHLDIAEQGSNEVVSVPLSGGAPTVVAGDGTCGNVPDVSSNTQVVDDVPAVDSQLCSPTGLATDSAGNLYIADTGHSLLREVDAAGTISTLYPTRSAASGLPEVTSPDTTRLRSPYAVAVDPHGNVYVGDGVAGNVIEVPGNVVATTPWVRVSPAANVANTVSGLAFDQRGVLYYAEQQAQQVFTGTLLPVAGSGPWADTTSSGMPAAASLLQDPADVTVGADGSMVVVDAHRVWEGTGNGLVPVAGTGFAPTIMGFEPGYGNDVLAGETSAPASIEGRPARSLNLTPTFAARDPRTGDLYVGDINLHVVLRVDRQGMTHVFAGRYARDAVGSPAPFRTDGSGGPANAAPLSVPEGIAVRADGAVYIAESAGDIGQSTGSNTDSVVGSSCISCGAVWMVAGGRLTLVAGGGGATCAVDRRAPVTGDGGPASQACLQLPMGITLDHAGNLYIADAGMNRIRKVDTQGTISTVAGSGAPTDHSDSATGYAQFGNGMDATAAGTLADVVRRSGVRRGRVPASAGDGLPATDAVLDAPTGVAADASGALFIADDGGHVVRRVDSGGIISTVAGSTVPTLESALGAAGSAPPARGDGGTATGAYLASATAVALDSRGTLYIADPLDNRVREVFGAAPSGAAVVAATTPSPAGSVESPADRRAEDAHVLTPHHVGGAAPRDVEAARSRPATTAVLPRVVGRRLA